MIGLEGLAEVKPQPEDEEVSSDAIQLLAISMFNGLCLVIRELAGRGHIGESQLTAMHDAMTTPLDDKDLRDDPFLVHVREALEAIMSDSMTLIRLGLRDD